MPRLTQVIATRRVRALKRRKQACVGYSVDMIRLLLLFLTCACHDDSSPSDDAGSDASSNDGAAHTCHVNLPDAVSGVTCGTSICDVNESCCLSLSQCAASCTNVDLAWRCDRPSHCEAGTTCCFGAPFLDTSTCPGTSAAAAPLCEQTCENVVCSDDADCAAGETCYAVVMQVASDASRSFGLCR